MKKEIIDKSVHRLIFLNFSGLEYKSFLNDWPV